MSVFIDDHAFRCFCFCYGIFTQIKFLALCSAIFICCDRIHNIALVVAECSIRCYHIFICCDFIGCSCKTFYFVYRLIDHIFAFLARYIHAKEYLPCFFHRNRTLLSHVRLLNLNQFNRALLCCVFFCHIE